MLGRRGAVHLDYLRLFNDNAAAFTYTHFSVFSRLTFITEGFLEAHKSSQGMPDAP